jgi:hypothetical protein
MECVTLEGFLPFGNPLGSRAFNLLGLFFASNCGDGQ